MKSRSFILLAALAITSSAVAEEINLSSDNSSTIHILAGSGDLTLTTGDSAVRVSSPAECKLNNSATAIQAQGEQISLNLSFSRDADTAPCPSTVSVPGNKMIIVEMANHDATITGAALSYLVVAENGSISFSDTGAAALNAHAKNGSIFVTRAFAALGLTSDNGNVNVKDSRGSLIVAGANNSVSLANFVFPAGSTNTIKTINGQVSTKGLRVLTVSNKQAVLNVKARAFSTIKFLRERRFKSFPGRKWFSRSYGRGRSSARLIVDANFAFTMN